jgi:hypothetical protein
MNTGRSSAECTVLNCDRNGLRRQYRAPSLAKGPILVTVTAGDTVISGVPA